VHGGTEHLIFRRYRMKRLLHLFPTKWWEMGTLFCVGVLPALLVLFFLRGGQANGQSSPPEDWIAPAVEVTQLPVDEKGVIPVEIVKAKAFFKSSNEIQEILAVVKNNTDKTILATSLEISFTTEADGVKAVSSTFLTGDSFIHPDIYQSGKIKPFAPGDVRVLESAARSYPANTLVKGLAVKFDYVEFSDGTTAGPDKDGSRILNQTRTGASKYKSWLEQKYINNGRSASTLLSAVESGEGPTGSDLPEYQRHGARAYQMHILETYKLRGAEEAVKNLNSVNR
jgi:hypothetical protein